LQPYYPTTRKNLLGFTQEFDNAAWNKSNTTVTANAAIDPQGYMTADKLVEDTATSGHLLFGVATVVTSAVYTYSAYIKRAERQYALMAVVTAFPTTAIQIDLDAGTVSTGTGSPLNSFCVPVGNGWFRCGFSIAATSTAGQFNIYTSSTGSWANRSYTGDGTSGIFIWGAQLSDSASLDPYVYNPGAAPASTAYYGPRFDYDPVTLAPKGLLIEEQRTNLALRSEEFDNVNWGKGNSTVTANAVVSPDGTVNADKLVENTATSSHSIAQSVSVTSGTTYTFTVYAKAAERSRILIAAASSAFTANQAIFNLVNGTTSGVVACTASMTPVGNGWYRCSWTATATASASPGFNIFLDNGSTPTYAGDGYSGVFIWGAQVEAGAFATSYIPTVASQVTRAADVAVMTGANFSNWYNQSEGAVFAEFQLLAVSSTNFSRILALSDGTTSNATIIYQEAASALSTAIRVGNVTQAYLPNVTPPNTNINKVASAYKLNDFAASGNGGAIQTDASGTLPTPVKANLGSREDNAAAFLNGHIRRIAAFPRRLANAELTALTS
jgi:hypothetical protein